MNPRPIQTGTQIVHFSRTFRHYIKTGTPNYGKLFDQQWSDIPYQYPAASMKVRDWQYINTAACRWRILEAGFNMMHLIPLINSQETVGGAIQPSLAFNLMPYCETYIDKGYKLPIFELYKESADFPNEAFSKNSHNQGSGALKMIAIDSPAGYTPTNTQSQSLNYYNQAFGWAFDLMNSTEWGTLLPTQQFSFEWTANAEDSVWRHALTPDSQTQTFTENSWQGAAAYGRWDGNVRPQTVLNYSQPNIHGLNMLKRNPTKPMPACLIRPAIFHSKDGTPLDLVFQCLVKYQCTIELDMNDIGIHPIFPRPYTEKPTGYGYYYDIYFNNSTAAEGLIPMDRR